MCTGLLLGSCYIAQGAQLGALPCARGVGWMSGREAKEEEDRCVHVAGSVYCTAETNITL